MICPYCDSVLNGISNAATCPNCGAKVFPNPPFKEKKIRQGSLEFNNYGVHLLAKLPRVPLKDIQVPYGEIFDVSYVPAAKWRIGFLCIRKWGERNVPLPMTFWQKKLTDSMIWFGQSDNVPFYEAYKFLKQCAQLNREEREAQ